MENIDLIQTDYNDYKCNGCKVHMGFLVSYKTLADGLLASTKALYGKYNAPILVTGHSLGGVQATFGAIDIYNQISKNVLYYSLEQPRAGN